MSEQIFAETTRYPRSLNDHFTYYVNNAFYLIAPNYYKPFYTIYLRNCLDLYDGCLEGYYGISAGYIPQKMLQSVARGLNNMLFASGIDFSCDDDTYDYVVDWSKKAKFLSNLKKAHLYSIAGGTSLMKLNRSKNMLFMTPHRMDTYYADVDALGKVQSVRVYLETITNTNPTAEVDTKHYCLCEERYFNDRNIPCVKAVCYPVSGTIQSEVLSRPKDLEIHPVNWEELPRNVKKFIKANHPSVMLGKEQFLPFKDSLGCFLLKGTEGIPQQPNMPFGQPIADILLDENFQYDQLKYFEKNEVDLARARAVISREMWNKDDPDFDHEALSERFYQAVDTETTEPITPIQFNMRASDIKVQRENILKDIAFKLNVSASSVASFLDEGQGAMTATQIISERTKSDTWIKSAINLITPEINEMLNVVMRYYLKEPVEIIVKSENQSPFLERLKTYSDVYSAGNMSDEAFVKAIHTGMSQIERQREIAWLQENKAKQDELQDATISSWTGSVGNSGKASI